MHLMTVLLINSRPDKVHNTFTSVVNNYVNKWHGRRWQASSYTRHFALEIDIWGRAILVP